VVGVAIGAAFTALTYYGLLAIPTRHIFTVTTALIALLAAGMAAQAVQFLYAAGAIDVLGQQLWDTSGILSQDGIVGRLLHTLVGYADRPTQLQLIAYLATLAVMVLLTKVAAPRSGSNHGAPAGKAEARGKTPAQPILIRNPVDGRGSHPPFDWAAGRPRALACPRRCQPRHTRDRALFR